MQVVRFQCPSCSADLKMRDEALTGRPVDCPECRQPFIVSLDSAGEIAVTRPQQPVPASKAAAKTAPAAAGARSTPAAPAASRPASGVLPRTAKGDLAASRRADGNALARAFSFSPRRIVAGLIAVALVACLAVGIFFWLRRQEQGPAPGPQALQPSKGQAGSSKAFARSGADSRPSSGPQRNAFQPDSAEGHLARLGELLEQYRKRQGNFPAGTAGLQTLRPNERFSWLAEFAAGVLFADQPGPIWFERWNDPRNDRFVRRRVPLFLNPSVAHLVSPQNYPATHFVGVAGVGEDAANLPVDHPRAGIFGNSRTTRLEDIRDGTSNTLMVLGVTSDLGSWAAGGPATVRPLTREPYVNGPDGFGTGPADRMTVLKADGSVQEMSAATDPRIFRRMAAMADGLPLDVKVPGEPGDRSQRPRMIGPLSSVRPSGTGLAPGTGSDNRIHATAPGSPRPDVASTDGRSVAEADGGEPRAPVVAVRPAGPPRGPAAVGDRNAPVDVAGGLRQRILRFEQVKPAPLQDVLNLIEELAGTPIRGEKSEIADLDDRLQTPVAFTLQNTTVREILSTALAKVGLTFEVKPEAIRLHKAN